MPSRPIYAYQDPQDVGKFAKNIVLFCFEGCNNPGNEYTSDLYNYDDAMFHQDPDTERTVFQTLFYLLFWRLNIESLLHGYSENSDG